MLGFVTGKHTRLSEALFTGFANLLSKASNGSKDLAGTTRHHANLWASDVVFNISRKPCRGLASWQSAAETCPIGRTWAAEETSWRRGREHVLYNVSSENTSEKYSEHTLTVPYNANCINNAIHALRRIWIAIRLRLLLQSPNPDQGFLDPETESRRGFKNPNWTGSATLLLEKQWVILPIIEGAGFLPYHQNRIRYSTYKKCRKFLQEFNNLA